MNHPPLQGSPGEPELRGAHLSPPTPPAEILTLEKEVAQSLLDAKEQAQQGGTQLQQLEAELQRASEEDTQLKASLLYPLLHVRNGRAPASSKGCVCSRWKTRQAWC